MTDPCNECDGWGSDGICGRDDDGEEPAPLLIAGGRGKGMPGEDTAEGEDVGGRYGRKGRDYGV